MHEDVLDLVFTFFPANVANLKQMKDALRKLQKPLGVIGQG